MVGGIISSYFLEGNDEDFRTLEVDSVVSIPQGVTCFNVTSGDVIHSFSCPALGVKVDAVPGKCNSFFSSILQPGFFLGSCAEICGVNHSFMPFCILVYDANFLRYYDALYSDYVYACSDSFELFDDCDDFSEDVGLVDSSVSGDLDGDDDVDDEYDNPLYLGDELEGIWDDVVRIIHFSAFITHFNHVFDTVALVDPEVLYLFMGDFSSALAEKVAVGASIFKEKHGDISDDSDVSLEDFGSLD